MTTPRPGPRALPRLFREHAAVWLVGTLGVLLSGAGFWVMQGQLEARHQLEFEWLSHERNRALTHGIETVLEAVRSVRDLFLVSERVSRHDFQIFAGSVIGRYRGIQALEWVPRVAGPERAAFEAEARREIPGFRITGQAAHGAMVAAGTRPEYFPILYAEPQAANRLAPGYDLAANPSLRGALERARDSGRMAVTGRIELLREPPEQYGFMACLPVYRKGAPTTTVGERRENLRGFAVGVFRIGDIAAASVALLEPRGVELLIEDLSAPEAERFLDFYSSRLSPSPMSGPAHRHAWAQSAGPHLTVVFPVADRRWSITSARVPEFLSAEAFEHGPWAVLAGGLLITALLGVYLLRSRQAMLTQLRMEHALREREELFWQMTETVDEVFWAVPADRSRFLYVSPAFEKIWQLSCEELYRQPAALIEGIHPEDRYQLSGAMERVRSQQQEVEVVYRVMRPDGSVRWVRDRAFPVRDDGNRVFRIVGVAEDITDKTLAEQALRESEQKLRTVFNQSPDIMMTVDREARILLVNRVLPQFPGERAVGQSSEALLPAEFRAWYRRTLDGVFASGDIDHFQYSLPDGTWWEVRLVPILDRREVAAVMVIAADVTENRKLQYEATRNARLASIGVLAAGVAHEINNPNNAILFNASLLSRAWQDVTPILAEYREEHGDYSLAGLPYAEARSTLPRLLADIANNAHRISSIVGNLKHLSKRDRGELDEEVDLQKALQAAVMILHNEIQKHTDGFHLVDQRLPSVKGNSQELEQVFINVLLNAVQSLPDRSRQVWVRSRHDPETDEAIITVRDQGCGIAEEHIGHLKEPFFTTKLDSGGTGLGLSIANAIMEKHRGALAFESRPGEGTTVTIRLPVAARRGT